jgi:hypothetical protein
MITYNGLIQLGFSSDDFELQDNSDGAGVFISEWNSASPQPSVAAIETAHTEWQTEYDSKQYARDRAEAYPSIVDQLDQQYHDMTAGKLDATGEWHKAIKAVKDANPKP